MVRTLLRLRNRADSLMRPKRGKSLKILSEKAFNHEDTKTLLAVAAIGAGVIYYLRR